MGMALCVERETYDDANEMVRIIDRMSVTMEVEEYLDEYKDVMT